MRISDWSSDVCSSDLGLLDAMREFCEFRNLLPRGLKLAPEDIWERIAFVLSMKMQEPQFSGQTKERLSSREAAAFVSGVVKDAFSLWLNAHPVLGMQLADLAISTERRVWKEYVCTCISRWAVFN